jgi:hypothetical protein
VRPSLKASLPALTTLSLSLCVMAVEQAFQVSAPRTFDVSAGNFSTAIVLNLGLLAALPFIGTAGASLAKWLGHSRKAAVESVMTPVALVSAMLLTLALFDLATTRFVVSSLAYSSGILLGWVLAPAAALLLGCYAGWKLTPQRPWYLRCW